jgi:nitrite reductase/ring-hydroxylating ferredoxin subunit
MEFVRLISINDLKPNEMKGIAVDDEPVLLVNLNGSYYAIGNVARAWGACSLTERSKETLSNVNATAQFSMSKTGNVIKGLAKKPEPKYELRVSDYQILVNI